MLLLLFMLSLAPADCEAVGDFVLGCERKVMQMGVCQSRVSWVCHRGHIPHLGI